MRERLTAIGRAIADTARTVCQKVAAQAAAVRAYLATSAPWLLFIAWPFLWLGTKFCRLVVWIVKKIVALIGWMLIPKPDSTPFDALKHYVAVIVTVIGFTALLWAGKQIAYPPLVITVAKLPDPVEKEYWLNPELARSLIGQIEGMRAVVKGERDPAFEAVLNPPNIVVKSGEFSLNVQEQILTPLGSLLGRGQGQVHLALTCYHPGCVRTLDKDCRELAPKAADPKPDAKPIPQQYLCLRLTADIQRGLSHRRLTPRLAVSTDDSELTEAMARIAEAVTTVADPATAALYFYRRIREEKRNPKVDPDVIADLVSEASKAAEEAENNDAVSACWAHSVRAHLAIDRGEFNLAETYLARAKSIHWWQHLLQATLPADCRRLIVIAEMEFARHLAAPPDNETYPLHPENENEIRVPKAFARIKRLLDHHQRTAWAGIFTGPSDADDLAEALKLVQSEIGLSWLKHPEQCKLLQAGLRQADLPQDEDGETTPQGVGSKPDADRARARQSIRDSIVRLNSLRPDEQLLPLARQSALDLMSRFARNPLCVEAVVSVLQKLDLNHPTDQRVTQLLIAITEAAALRKTASLGRPAEEGDRGNPMIDSVHKIYQRMAATGADRTGFALSRLAIIAEAKSAEQGEEETLEKGPREQTLQSLRRAWRRFERDPRESRERAELIVSFWGMVLLRSYPDSILMIDFSRESAEVTANAEYRSVIANKTEFERALRVLYPAARPVRLSDLPHLSGIGSRIGCLCMLSYVTTKSELADFFIDRLDKWQKGKVDEGTCRADMIPAMQTLVPTRVRIRASMAKSRYDRAERALRQASAKTPELQKAYNSGKAYHELMQGELKKAADKAEANRQVFRDKSEVVKAAAKVCHVTEKVAQQAP